MGGAAKGPRVGMGSALTRGVGGGDETRKRRGTKGNLRARHSLHRASPPPERPARTWAGGRAHSSTRWWSSYGLLAGGLAGAPGGAPAPGSPAPGGVPTLGGGRCVCLLDASVLRAGEASAALARPLVWELELAHSDAAPLVGLALDFSKCYDRSRRGWRCLGRWRGRCWPGAPGG